MRSEHGPLVRGTDLLSSRIIDAGTHLLHVQRFGQASSAVAFPCRNLRADTQFDAAERFIRAHDPAPRYSLGIRGEACNRDELVRRLEAGRLPPNGYSVHAPGYHINLFDPGMVLLAGKILGVGRSARRANVWTQRPMHEHAFIDLYTTVGPRTMDPSELERHVRKIL